MKQLATKDVFNNGLFCRQKAQGVTEFFKALEKHHEFPAVLTDQDKHNVETCAECYRAVNDSGESAAVNIYLEEWYEFIQAVQNGDLENARHELAQCHAVLHRIGQHLETYVAKKGGV